MMSGGSGLGLHGWDEKNPNDGERWMNLIYGFLYFSSQRWTAKYCREFVDGGFFSDFVILFPYEILWK